MTSNRPPMLPCDECHVVFDEASLERSDAFGVRLVCEDCALAISDEGVFELHAEDDVRGRCECQECGRHRRRVERVEAGRQLELIAEGGESAADEPWDVGF